MIDSPWPDASILYKSPEGCAAMMAWYDSLLAQSPIPLESRSVPTRFGETHMLACGSQDAPPLLLVMGLGGSAPLWRHQFADFAAHFRVYALDTVGMPGRSAPTRMRLWDYPAWLADVLDSLSIERADFVGISMGGRLVLQFASVFPARVGRLALLSSIGFVRLRLGLIGELLPVGFDLGRPGPEKLDQFVNMALTKGRIAVDEAMAEMTRLFIQHVKIDGRRNLALPLGLPGAVLRGVTAPTLLLMGEYEALFDPQAVIRRARRVLPDLVAAERVPAAGHSMIGDNPAWVNARVLAFLLSAG